VIALEVTLDGQPVCLAGVGESGVLMAIVHFVSDMAPGEEVFLSVGGIDGQTGEMLDWNVPPLAIGSEVLVRVTEAAEVDPPHKRSAGPAPSRTEQFRRHLQKLAAEMTDAERQELIRELVAELQG
jgi:hypothetical protein